jgi:two-component system NtrC family sensor kinase
MWTFLHRRIRSTLRYRLLALVLLPLLLALFATLGYTLYWLNTFTSDTLYVAARNNLTLARYALRQIQDEHQTELQQLADAPQFRALLRQNDAPAVVRVLRRLREARGFAFLHVTGPAGNWLYETRGGADTSSKPSPLTDRAARGLTGAALEVFRVEDLRREDPQLVERARLARDGTVTEERALMMRIVQPVNDEDGRVVMVLDGAVLLNHNSVVLDAIRNRVFAAGTLPEGAEPIVTLLLDDVRVASATTVLANLDGARVAAKPARGASETWVGRDPVGEHGFIAAYGPLFDVNGQRIGMLHVGFLEQAFQKRHAHAALLLLALFLAATGTATWIALRGLRSVFQPIETMATVARATQAGEERRIGPIGSHDEIGQLARQFDLMLDQLARRNQELKRAAATLDANVAVCTLDLQTKNTDLEATVRLLQKTREQLLMAEKLSAMGVLSAGVAHEINNPLAVIQGNLEVLAAELGNAAKPVEREIELIASQVDRIRHIVTSLLQFARPADSMAAIMEVDVNRAVGDVLPLVAHALKMKAIALHTRLRASGAIGINLYELEQVLINLLLNAANAVSSGGRIEVETANCDGDRVAIRVRDNGAGIPAALLTRVFDPFFTTDPRHGTGLGLSVSYGIIRHYGGDISVESTVGKGSVFELLLRREPIVAGTVTAQTAGQPAERRVQAPFETTEADHERRGIVG